jgi:hypothetical protein
MHFPVPNPDGESIIEVDARTTVCVVPSCRGTVVRHSLGGGQSIDRCTRCFRRYQLRRAPSSNGSGRSRLRRALDEFIAWREDRPA